VTEPNIPLTALTDDDNVRFIVVDDDEGDQVGTGLTNDEVTDLLNTPPDADQTLTASADTESLYATDQDEDLDFDVHDPGIIKISAEAYGSDRGLREYWTHGEGAAKIRWGTPGDFKRCVRHLRKYVTRPEGLCNEYHTEAVGAPPGKGHSGETESFEVTTVDAPVQRVGTANPRSIPWEGTLALEGTETGDGREFALGSLTWADLPLPLMYQYETSHGGSTDKSTNVGNITEVWRDDNRIMGRGTIDLNDPYGLAAARKMRGKYLNGVSIDADSVKDSDVELIYAQPDPNASDEQQLIEMIAGAAPEKTIFHKGRVRGATLVNLPAFVDATLELTGDLSMLDEQPLTAAAEEHTTTSVTNHRTQVITAAASSGKRGYTIEIPEVPPLEFFQEPRELPPIGAVWIEPNGHIFGLVGPSGVPHRAFRNKRIMIPMGNVDYTRWMNRPTVVMGEDGELIKIRTGVITMNCGHLSPYATDNSDERMRHYDNSCSIAAVVRVGESRQHKAPWVAGAIMPMSTADFQRFQACQLSGDWAPHRERRGWKEFVASLAVPVPGFARSTNVAAVRVDDNSVVTASSVPIMLSEDAFMDEVEVNQEDLGRNRMALGAIRASMSMNNRQTLASIRQRVGAGAATLTAAATATPLKERKVGCTPCAAKRRTGETSAQQPPVQQVTGFGDGDPQQQAATSQANAIANARGTSRG
jgi:hypothetical protein